jgi:predicted Zn-dependent peptidase
VDESVFRRIKRSTYGLLIRELNNVDAVANLMINSHMDGVAPYDAIDVISALTAEEVNCFVKNELQSDKVVLSVIEKDGGST